MNTKLVNSAAGVILAALTQNRTAAGIALELESAGLLMTPETAADMASVSTDAVSVAELAVAELRREHEESARLRAQVAELEKAQGLGDRERVELLAGFERALEPFCAEPGAAAAAVAAVRDPDREWLLRDAQRLQDRVIELEARAAAEADGITARIAPTQALREDAVAPKCRCDEPGADPYSCEADDCTGEFSELNPFGGGPAQGHDAKVSRTCETCGWKTSVWHVADGSAEEELHGHTVRVHGGQPVAGAS